MDFLEMEVGGRQRLVGLISGASDVDSIIVHVHGYGGDLFSNTFVREQHRLSPAYNLGFASLRLPTSSYIDEDYTDIGVRYIGSSLVHPNESVRYIAEVVGRLQEAYRHVFLQGHSFGTNLVKEIVSGPFGDSLSGAIFLSPADSASLQAMFLKEGRAKGQDSSDGIVWNTFGIATGDRSYPIPIMNSLFTDIVSSSIFNTWSAPNLGSLRLPWLVVRASGDSIANAGSLASLDAFGAEPEGGRAVELASQSHAFADQVPVLVSMIFGWVSESMERARTRRNRDT